MGWKVGVLTVSDRVFRGERDDGGGLLLCELVRRIDGEVAVYEIIPDEQPVIEETLVRFVDEVCCDLVLTTGGTGFAPRDVTPEATKAVIEKEAPGLTEMMRMKTLSKTKYASLSRSVAGIRKETLIINFPGNPKGVQECFDVVQPVLPHALALIKGKDVH